MPDKKEWTLVTKGGKELGGTFTGSPGAAAKKSASSMYAKPSLPHKRNGSVKVYLRQTSIGNKHNQVVCYNVSQKMVKIPAQLAERWNKPLNSLIPEKKSKKC